MAFKVRLLLHLPDRRAEQRRTALRSVERFGVRIVCLLLEHGGPATGARLVEFRKIRLDRPRRGERVADAFG